MDVLLDDGATKSAVFRKFLAQLDRFARCDETVVLEGERGTGKTLVAERIHQVSRRAHSRFIGVSLAALDDALASSALFGHVRGAFTDARTERHGYFVTCDGGTLFLDEIGRASRHVQGMLLRVIEDGEVWPLGAERPIPSDVRTIVASNVPLEQLVDRDTFLPDLFDRLGWFRLRVPPLRDRREDIPMLAARFVAAGATRCGYDGSPPDIHSELEVALVASPWPGNVRQLRGTMLRIMVDACGASKLTLAHCQGDLAYLRNARAEQGIDAETVRRAITETGSKSGASRVLGVSRTTVYNVLGRSSARSAL